MVRSGGGVRMERFKQISWKRLNVNSITWEGLQRAESWPEPKLQRWAARLLSFYWPKFRLVVKTALTENKTFKKTKDHLGFKTKTRPRIYIPKNINNKTENNDQEFFRNQVFLETQQKYLFSVRFLWIIFLYFLQLCLQLIKQNKTKQKTLLHQNKSK